MTPKTRSLTLLAALVALAGCGPDNGAPALRNRADFTREDGLTVCAAGSTTKGIDVSEWQGSINWTSVANAGIKFAYIRVSDGTGHMDPDFTTNMSHAKAAGLITGTYQFFEPSESASAQAQVVVNAVGKLGAGDLPVMMDVETATPTTSELNTWLSAVETGTGKKPIIYTSSGLWNGWFSGGFGSYGLDVANWGVSCPGMPAGWTGWQFWQYADNTSVSGISGNVDGDYFNGDLAALQQYAGEADCGGKPDGDYCGGDGPTGDANSLYSCTSNQATLIQACNSICAKSAAGDFCQKPIRPHDGVDVDGDGKADLCARDSSGVSCWLSTGSGFGGAIAGPPLSNTSGWGALTYYDSITMVDVDGDGKADVCGRGVAGEMCWLGNGSGFPTATAQGPLTDASGWTAAKYRDTIQFGDIDGNGKQDLCARAAASFECWKWNGNGFGTGVTVPDMGDAQGWDQVQYYSTIVVADVTGDGKADVCGRGWGGFECWVSSGSAFTAVGTYVDAFSDTNGGDAVSVYSTIQLADIDGDGKLDVCGRTTAGYECYKGDGTGKFPTHVAGPALSDAQGWGVAKYFSTIQLADINGDGKADVCGRGTAGISCWLSNGSGFPTQITGPALSDASGWGAGIYDSTLTFADVDGDGRADLCGRAAAGWQCWLSTGTGFSSTSIVTSLLSDSSGMDGPSYVTTIQLTGTAFGHVQTSTTTSTSTSTSTSGSSGSTGTSTTTTTTGSTGGPSTSTTTTGTTGTSTSTTTAGSTASSTTTSTTSTAGSTGTGSTTASSTTGTTGSHSSSTTSSTGTTEGGTTTTTSTSTGASTTGTTGGGSTGLSTTATTATGTTASATAGSSTGGSTSGTKSGGCSSADGSSLFGLGLVLLVLRRRKS